MPPETNAGGNNPPEPLTQEQLHAAIEKARLEERERVRKPLEDAQAAAKAREDAIAAKDAELARLKGSLDALEKAKTPEGLDVKALITEVTTNVEKRYADTFTKEREALSNQVNTLQQDLTRLQLEKLQAKLVKEVGGPDKVVFAMIHGNTEAELRASVTAAHEAYLDIENRVKKTAEASNPGGKNAAPPVVPAGGSGGSSVLGGDLVAQAKKLSPEEWAANRVKILSSLTSRYSQGQ
jgi:hypothetical protein